MDVAIAEAGSGVEVRFYGRIGGDLDSLDRVIRKLRATGAQLRFAYEAGPCGYQVYSHLTAQGRSCLVAAPALIPRRPGALLLRHGRITKTGNGHARRILVEAASAYRLRARVTRPVLQRQEGLSEKIRQIPWQGAS